MLILACDPGLTGALAWLDGDVLWSYNMPFHFKDTGKKAISEAELVHHIQSARRPDLFVIENVGGVPGQSGPGSFNFGLATGIIKGIIAAYNIRREEVTPAVWKKALRVPADKEAARMRACELLPRFSNQWPLKKDHGKAEAAMLALYAQQRWGALLEYP